MARGPSLEGERVKKREREKKGRRKRSEGRRCSKPGRDFKFRV
jgi:hypothetical protein